MPVRTTETTVTFRRPFEVSSLSDLQPAGTHRLVTDEEQISGLSFLAYRRTATMLRTPAISVRSGSSQMTPIDCVELAAALEADARA